MFVFDQIFTDDSGFTYVERPFQQMNDVAGNFYPSIAATFIRDNQVQLTVIPFYFIYFIYFIYLFFSFILFIYFFILFILFYLFILFLIDNLGFTVTPCGSIFSNRRFNGSACCSEQ